MSILLDAIAALAVWGSTALLAWGAAICMGELLASARPALLSAVNRPQFPRFR
jgi:hypothetical protein